MDSILKTIGTKLLGLLIEFVKDNWEDWKVQLVEYARNKAADTTDTEWDDQAAEFLATFLGVE